MDSTITITLGPTHDQVHILNAATTEPSIDIRCSESSEYEFDGTTVTYDAERRALTLTAYLAFELSSNEHAMVLVITPMNSVTVAGKTARLDDKSDTDEIINAIPDDMRTRAQNAGRFDLASPSFGDQISAMHGNDDSHLAVIVPPHMQHDYRRYERAADDPLGHGPNH